MVAITRSIIKIHAHAIVWEKGGLKRNGDYEGWNAQLISRKAKEGPHKMRINFEQQQNISKRQN